MKKIILLILVCIGYLYPQASNTIPRRVDTLETDVDSLYTKTSQIYNLKEFGAVGDSVTDDTPNIQAALDFIESLGGGTLYINNGQYRIDTSLFVPSNIKIIGQSWEAIIENGGNDFRAFNCSQSSNIIFDGFTIRGDFTDNPTYNIQQGGIFTDNWLPGYISNNITIQNMYFNNLGSDAITFLKGTHHTKVINCTFEDGLGFVQYVGTNQNPVSDGIVTGCTILASPDGSIPPNPMTGSDDLVDMWGNISGIIVSNNYFDARREKTDTTDACKGFLISSTDDTSLYGVCDHIRVENNIFKNFHNAHTTYSYEGAILIYGGQRNVSIVNNTFDADSGYHIVLAYPAEPVEITGNTFIGGLGGVYVNDNQNDPNWPINVIKHNIKSNTFRGFTANGIYLINKGAVISNNIFDMSFLTENDGNAINVSRGDSAIISNNIFFNGGSASYVYHKNAVKWGVGTYGRIVNNDFMDIQSSAIYIGNNAANTNISLSGNRFSKVTTQVTDAFGTAFDLAESNNNREYAERYYTGIGGYLYGDDREVYSVNKEGKITELTHNLAQTTPYELVNESAFARSQGDIISGFFLDEVKERQGQFLAPTIGDTLNIWLETSGALTIDSVRLVSDDSATVQVYFGSDSLFDSPALVNLDTVITSFDTHIIPINSRVKLFFTALGDGVTDFNFLIYYRQTGSNSFIKNYLTNIFLDRVTKDGGTIIDTSAISDFYDMMILNGIVDSVTNAWSTTYAVKMDADSNITKLYDLSIYKNDIVQADTTYSPDYQASGITTASFDGDDDYMQVQIEGMEQPETIFLVGRARVQEGSSYFYDGYNAQSGALLMSFGGGISELLIVPTEGCTEEFIEDTDILFTASFDGANSSLQLDNATADACSLNTTAMGGITLGKVGGNPLINLTGWAQVNLTEQIILNVNASATLRTAIKTFLNNKYSL